MTWLALLVLIVVSVPIVGEISRKKMNENARANAPGEFAKLSQGITHYKWYGPKSGPIVVCIHGLTTPSFVWRSLAKGLVDQGFRVLTYDLFGRGYSDRPTGIQDQAFFLKQLNELLDDQQVTEKLTVIGYSMGGVIATGFAHVQTERVRDLILLAPAGMKTKGFGLLRQVSALPGIGLWVVLAFYPRMLRRGILSEADLATSVDGLNDLQLAELDWRGFFPSVRESIRGILAEGFEPAHRDIAKARLPVLAVFGRDDDIIPADAADLLVSWNPRAETHILDGAGHGVTYTHTDKILELVDGFTALRH